MANVALIVLKLAAAIATGSLGVIAELLHSSFDLLASCLAYLGIHKSLQPADDDHHYGHEKFENLSSLAQATLIFITGIMLIFEAAQRLANPLPVSSSILGIAIIAITILADYALSKRLGEASVKYGSAALKADSANFATDLWGGIAVMIGLALSAAGYPAFDPVAAIVVAILMLVAASKLGWEELQVLSDQCPSESTIKEMDKAIISTKGVVNYHKLKARQAGNAIFADVHIRVNGKDSVLTGHRIAHDVKANIIKQVPQVKEITIHIEPAQGK
jgi:cation diffusion facilitator family transporter